MSKVDAMRALREQLRNEIRALESGQRVAKGKPAKTPQAPASATTSVDAVCGHRGMGNRPCIRPPDHPEKSHRYGPAPSAKTVQQ